MTSRTFTYRALGAVFFALAIAAPSVAHAKGPSGKAKTEHKPGGGAKSTHKKGAAAPPSAPVAHEKPAVIEAPPVAFAEPAAIRDTTPAGLAVVVSERSGATDAVITLRLPFGSSADPVDQGGLVAVTASAVAESDVPERARFVSRGGAETVRVDADAVTFVLTAPASEAGAAIDLLAAELAAPVAADAALAARARETTSTLGDDAAALRDALVYQGYFPYEHRGRGPATYLSKVQAPSVEELRKARFDVTGATLSAVVPASAATVVAKAKETFGGAPRGAAPAPAGALAEQTNQRSSDIEEAGAPTVLSYGWAVRGGSARELEALELTAELLGESDRVADALGKAGIDGRATARLERRVGPSLFTLDVHLAEGADVSKAKHAIDDALADLGKHAAAPPELARAKRALSIERARELDDAVTLAEHLARGGSLTEERATVDALTAEELPKVAARFLGPLTRSVVETRDPSRPKPPAPHAAPAVAAQPAHAPAADKPAPKHDAEPKHHAKGHKK